VAPARPTPSGNLIITGRRTDVFVPPGGYVDFALPPLPNSAAITPMQSYFVVDDRLQSREEVESSRGLGVFRLDAARLSELPTRRIRAGVLDNKSRAFELMQCAVRSRDPGPRVSLEIEREKDRIRLLVPDRRRFGSVYLFWESQTLGSLPSNSSSAEVDARTLAPGVHRFYVIAETPDGTLLPCAGRSLRQEQRFDICTLENETEWTVPIDNPGMALPVRIVQREGTRADKVRVYFSGNFVGESDKPAFDTAVPLRDVPSGKAMLEVIGIGSDGVRYPMESLTLRLKNLPWEARILATPEHKQIKVNLAKIAELEPQAAYWTERANAEARVIEHIQKQTSQHLNDFGSLVTTTSYHIQQRQSKRGEYRANARKFLEQIAQIRLETSRLYRNLGMWEWAEQSYRRTLREAAQDSSSYALAKKELAEMLAQRQQNQGR
jgi:hypothetical protein